MVRKHKRRFPKRKSGVRREGKFIAGKGKQLSLEKFARNQREFLVGQRKFDKVMREFFDKTLTTHGRTVTSRGQALAIAHAEARGAINRSRAFDV